MNKNLNNLPKDSAGRIMTNNVPVVGVNTKIKTIENYLLKNIKQMESVNYVYVVNKKKELRGVLSIKELFRQSKEKKVSSVMIKDLVKARLHTDQERVSYLALENNIKAVPIVDDKNKFLGVILSDDILRVVYEESQEDISHFAGVDQASFSMDDITKMPLLKALKHRLPWLLLGILGGMVTVQIIHSFENILSKNIILVAFIPLVVYIAGAVSTQVGFFVVRDLSIKKKIDFLYYTFRQFRVVISMGVIISIFIFLFSLLFYKQVGISLVLASAVLLATLSSIITGLFVPYIFTRFNCDPANASGPIANVVQDLISVIIYLAVASFLI